MIAGPILSHMWSIVCGSFSCLILVSFSLTSNLWSNFCIGPEFRFGHGLKYGSILHQFYGPGSASSILLPPLTDVLWASFFYPILVLFRTVLCFHFGPVYGLVSILILPRGFGQLLSQFWLCIDSLWHLFYTILVLFKVHLWDWFMFWWW